MSGGWSENQLDHGPIFTDDVGGGFAQASASAPSRIRRVDYRDKWRRDRGIDIEARRASDRWIIEAKGIPSRPQGWRNYYLSAVGLLLTRMNDETSKYSVAFIDTPQYRKLWAALPPVAKARTTISALFVSPSIEIEEVD